MNGAILSPGVSGGSRTSYAWLLIGLVGFLPDIHAQSGASDNGALVQSPASAEPPGGAPYFPSSGYNDSGNSERFQFRRLPVFFPPLPPRLEEPLDPPALSQSRRAAPAELAAFVNEPFYAPLGTRLFQNDLKPKLRARLDAYRAAKSGLQGELRVRLAALEGADPGVREHELAAFALQQTPRIAALEKTAEELRSDLIAGGFFDETVDWNDSRPWQLGVSRFRTPTEAMLAQYQVMRAATFYQKGLSPAQRRLVREVAMELAEIGGQLIESGEATTSPAAYADSNPPLFFSPETARIRLPTGLPSDLARAVAAYESDKSKLKQELREALYAGDSAHFDFLRTRALENLAKQQEPRIAALEAQAEEIRRGLSFLPEAMRPPPAPPLPPTLVARLAALLEDKRTAHNNVLSLVQQIKRLISVTRVDATKDDGGRPKLSVVVSPEDRTEAKLKPVRELVARYNAENLSRLDAIDKESSAFHEALVQFVSTKTSPDEVEKTTKDLLEQATASIERQQEWVRYHDYRAAVLEPGLSPEQRRLLYDGALEALELPLPGSERPVVGVR